MARTTRADEAGGAYHALNRGNARQRIFDKEAGYEAFERILADGLARCGKIKGVRKIKGARSRPDPFDFSRVGE